jgi:putative aldouronate transport system permease protein
MKRNSLLYELNKNKALFIMVLPAVLFYLAFAYIPMSGIVMAFKSLDYGKGIWGSPWVGFQNFDFFFKSGQAFLVTKNTILYNLAFIVTGLILQVTMAVIFSEMAGKYFKKITQSLMFFPYFVSWVVVGAFVYNLFNYEFGTINTFLKTLHVHPIDFYSQPGLWKYILIFFNNWNILGYNTIIYLSAIMGIDISLYEAAEIDGANLFKRIRFITIPLLVPTMIIMVMFAVGYMLRGNLNLFYNIIGNNGLLFNATDVIDTFVYRSLTTSSEFGLPAAVSFYQSVFGFILIITLNFIVKKLRPENSLF